MAKRAPRMPGVSALTTMPMDALRYITERNRLLYLIPSVVTIAWILYMLMADEFGRAIDHWQSTITMIFGSFLAGSSPVGSGGVAFPVFTKALEVPAAVARSFALCIQAVGMTTASATILLARRPIERRAVLAGMPVGVAGFLVALVLIGDRDTPFWEATVDAAYVKVTFTIVLAGMACFMFLTLRDADMGTQRITHWTWRVWVGLALAAFLGGALSALIGTGANVLVFLFIVVMARLHPGVGVPTSILIMTGVAIAGLLTLGVFDGQLDVGLDANGNVVSVGGEAVGPLDPDRYDLFGLWIAAVPVVVWGAPLGTWVVHRLHESRLVKFVGTLAAFEVISTFVLLEQVREDAALLLYATLGLAVAVGGVWVLRRYRESILGI